MNDPVMFMAKGRKVQPMIRGTNLVNIYGFLEGSCVIPNKAAYMDDDTWVKVVKVLSPGIREMQVSNVACVFPVYSLYI